MVSLRKRKMAICLVLRARAKHYPLNVSLRDEMRAVGREFGSPDFERLMAEDHRRGAGVFDPALKGQYVSGVEAPEDRMAQHRGEL